MSSGGYAVNFGDGNPYPEVNTFADLPSPPPDPTKHVYIVLNASGAWYTFDRKDSGLYYWNGATWSILDQIPYYFSSSTFRIQDGTDATKQLAFNISGLSTGTTKTITVPNFDINLGTLYNNGGNSFGSNATLGTNDNFTLAFKTNNVTALTFDTAQNAVFSGQAKFITGTAINPSILFSGSATNTGIYTSGVDQIAILIVGANRAVFSSTGLGISGGVQASNGVTITGNSLIITTAYAASSGSTAFNFSSITGSINQTSTATGTVRGIYYNPIVTSVLGTHYAWHSTSGDMLVGGGGVYKITENGGNKTAISQGVTSNYLRIGAGFTGIQLQGSSSGMLSWNGNLSFLDSTGVGITNVTISAGILTFPYGGLIITQTLGSTNTGNTYSFRSAATYQGSGGTYSAFDGVATINSTTTGVVSMFNANPTLTAYAGIVTGFRGQIASGTNRYNIYADGTAPNYLKGLLQVDGGIKGTTTNDNAVAGNVGEYVESVVVSGSAVSLTSTTPSNITSISLSAGDWDIEIAGYFKTSGTSASDFQIGFSTTSATIDTTPGRFNNNPTVVTGLSGDLSANLVRYRLSLSSTTTVYFVAQSTFTVGTVAVYGIISARRPR